jgi:hypothetical protein
MATKKTGCELIAEERKRQIEKEGWTEQHDKEHSKGELAIAGACYAFAGIYGPDTQNGILTPDFWPWDEEWWKPCPGNRIKELTKAGALIAAEIDRELRKQNQQ